MKRGKARASSGWILPMWGTRRVRHRARTRFGGSADQRAWCGTIRPAVGISDWALGKWKVCRRCLEREARAHPRRVIAAALVENEMLVYGVSLTLVRRPVRGRPLEPVDVKVTTTGLIRRPARI